MKAMVLEKLGIPLNLIEIPKPKPLPFQILIKVHACGVCRTDLHIVDGELTHPKLPLILGHQIVGDVVALGSQVTGFKLNDRVGVPWLGSTCGKCEYCIHEQENLCDHACFTGYQINGGYAEFCVADARYCFLIPPHFSDLQAAPLLCAGLIGYRALRFAGTGKKLGFYGFGSSAHILTQVAHYRNQEVYAFVRKSDKEGAFFAEQLGVKWVGSSEEMPPELLDGAIIFAPVGNLVPLALKALKKGGTVVIAGIHLSNIPSFNYDLLWGERVIRSVANLTRKDGVEFLELAAKIPIETHIHLYPLERANDALDDVRKGAIKGSCVLTI